MFFAELSRNARSHCLFGCNTTLVSHNTHRRSVTQHCNTTLVKHNTDRRLLSGVSRNSRSLSPSPHSHFNFRLIRKTLTDTFSLLVTKLTNTWGAFFYSQFWNENGQNVKYARFSIPHSYSGMDRTPFHPFCSQGQNEQNVANENPRWRTAR